MAPTQVRVSILAAHLISHCQQKPSELLSGFSCTQIQQVGQQHRHIQHLCVHLCTAITALQRPNIFLAQNRLKSLFALELKQHGCLLKIQRSGLPPAGKRLEESKKINQSLSALGNVIAALTDHKGTRAHIPYRSPFSPSMATLLKDGALRCRLLAQSFYSLARA